MNKYIPVKNLKDLIQSFSDEAKCRQFLIQQIWDGCPECPYCKSDKYYVIENGKRFKCGNKECLKKYSVTVGSIFHASNIPLTTWFPAIYLITSHKKGISSLQLARDLGITQKTAWFMLHRVRESLKRNGSSLLKNTVEIDEVYIGGKVGNMSNKKRAKLKEENKTISDHKTMVIGMLERQGELRLVVSKGVGSGRNIYEILNNNVDKSAQLMTDGDTVYQSMQNKFAGHETVNHSIREYVRNGMIHTNSIEGAFSLFKRSIIGIYHQISPKHLGRYCTETEYRYNTRKLKDGERFETALTRVAVRLSHKELIKETEFTAITTISPALPDNLQFNTKQKGRPIYQLKNNVIIARFNSSKEAALITGVHVSDISKVLRGLRKYAQGFSWKYV